MNIKATAIQIYACGLMEGDESGSKLTKPIRFTLTLNGKKRRKKYNKI